MKQAGFVVLFTAILLIFTGCPEFFTFNIYDGLDPVFPPDKAKLDDLGTAEALDYLEEEIASDSFIDALVQDDTNTPDGENSALDDVKEYLTGVYIDPTQTSEDRSTAAVLAADVALETSGAIDVVNGIYKKAAELSELSTNGTPTQDDVKTILNSIVPAEIVTNEQSFKDLLNGFFTAADAYEVLGNDIVAGGAEDGGAVSGGVVINAAVTLVIDQIATGLVPSGDRADELWNLLQGDTSNVQPSFSLTDPLSSSTIQNIGIAGDFDISTLFSV